MELTTPSRSHKFILMVVYDVKDTKFEWNSQQALNFVGSNPVVYDVKDTKFEWNSQQHQVHDRHQECCL